MGGAEQSELQSEQGGDRRMMGIEVEDPEHESRREDSEPRPVKPQEDRKEDPAEEDLFEQPGKQRLL